MRRISMGVLSLLASLAALAPVPGWAVGPPLGDYVIFGENGVMIGRNSEITGLVGARNNNPVNDLAIRLNGGAQILADPANAVAGDARSGGNVRLGFNAHIEGTLTRAPGTALSLALTASVGADVVADPELPAALPAPTAIPGGCPIAAPGDSGGSGQARVLAPGVYGDLEFGGRFTLTFATPGNYYFNSIRAGTGATLNVAPGTRVFVCRFARFGSVDVLPASLAPADFSIEVRGGSANAFRAGGSSNWIGDVFAPNGGIHIGSGGSISSFLGRLHAAGVVAIEHGVTGRNGGPCCPQNEPDVAVKKSTTTPTVAAGGTASYGITVTVSGTSNANNVTLTDVLPGGAALSWTVTGPDAGACSPNPAGGGATLVCTFGTMAPGDTKSITLTATVSQTECPALRNTATVTAAVDANSGNNSSGPVIIVVQGCAPTGAVHGKTKGFWGNKNVHKVLDGDGNGILDTSVFIGGPTRGFTVTTVAQSDKILGNDACVAGAPTIFAPCTFSAGLQTNTLEVLAAQTLALTYNIGKIAGYNGQTMSALGCDINSTLAALGLGASSTVGQVLAVANALIDHSTSGGSTTQPQAGAMNALLGGCVNRE